MILTEQVAEILKRKAPDGGPAVDVDALASTIFAQPGHKYFFLFNQNFRKTNIHIAELMSLIRKHLIYVPSSIHVPFITFENFDYIKRVFSALCDHLLPDDNDIVDRLVTQLLDYSAHRILIEIYYGSAAIFLPMHLTLELSRVCGESGYIHSCGHLLLLRNASKATAKHFSKAIKAGLSLRPTGEQFLLVPYCHEDFSGIDQNTSPFLAHGLDDVKINISKAYVGDRMLFNVIEEIAEDNISSIFLRLGNYSESRQAFSDEHPGVIPSTMWVLSDTDVSAYMRFPGERKFYVMYLQEYRNHNYYHLFDEDKPGWVSHTTLPHSLAGAMINLARPWFPKGSVNVIDPFGGSGTIFLEAQKFADIRCLSRDLAPIFDYAVEDNVKFFALNGENLGILSKELRVFLLVSPEFEQMGHLGRRAGTPERKLGRVINCVNKWVSFCDGDFLELSKVQLVERFADIGVGIVDRILLYVALRASVRGRDEMRRQTTSWTTFFRRELNKLLSSIENYMGYISTEGVDDMGDGRLRVGSSSYSRAVWPRPPVVDQADLFGQNQFEIGDVLNLPRNQFDAVITDPPYGFNTVEDYWDSGRFTANALLAMIRALKIDGGQLILAAPEVSFSGRGIHPFVQSRHVIRAVINLCLEDGRECVVPATGMPPNMTRIRPPYYWISEKTLRRQILQFWIRKL